MDYHHTPAENANTPLFAPIKQGAGVSTASGRKPRQRACICRHTDRASHESYFESMGRTGRNKQEFDTTHSTPHIRHNPIDKGGRPLHR